MYGGNLADTLDGGSGEDWLFGNAGDDVLKGESGRDYLGGGTGDDTYIVSIGDGQDTINEAPNEGNDTLELGAGLDAANTQVLREITDLVLRFNATNSVRITGYFNGGTVEHTAMQMDLGNKQRVTCFA